MGAIKACHVAKLIGRDLALNSCAKERICEFVLFFFFFFCFLRPSPPPHPKFLTLVLPSSTRSQRGGVQALNPRQIKRKGDPRMKE